MIVSIDPALKQHCPGLQLACVEGVVEVAKSSDHLVGLLNGRAEELARRDSSFASTEPEVMATREAYRILGKDPSRYRGSAEALLRRVVSGKGLYFVNNLVDINNLISLESFLPVGSYDLAKVIPPIVFRVGRAGEAYKGIGKDVINLTDLPVFTDSSGPFGSPTSDSERAKITAATGRFAMMIISFSGKSDLASHARRAVQVLESHAGGHDLSFEIADH